MSKSKKFIKVCTPTEDGEQCVYYPKEWYGYFLPYGIDKSR